jgi:mono/diheme cytochrome c family protein
MRTALALALIVALGALGGWALMRPQTLTEGERAALSAHAADPENGARVFWASGCAGCHAAPGLDMAAPTEARLLLGGGRRLESPFGTFIAPNVSMDPAQGLGNWTLDQFVTAVLLGVSPQGRHYYPAFPYTHYIRARPTDIADLWAFWQGLPADPTPSAGHALRFPYNLRAGIGLWKRLYLDPDLPPLPPGADAQVSEGHYLVEALGHCAECHSPRDRFGGLSRAAWMQGAPNPSGSGRIPPIPDPAWSAEDISAYLFSGFTPGFDVVGGSMADVVAHMARLPASDRDAIAAYLVAQARALRSSPNP